MKTVTVEEEYEKNKHIKPEDVKILLDWAQKQPHLPTISELECIFFLNSYEGSIELTKNLIDIYYTSRTHCPEFFANRNPRDLIEQMHVGLQYPFEQSDLACSKTFYVVYTDTNPANVNVNEQIKILWMVFDVWMLENGCFDSVNFIVDMKGIQLGHVAKYSISTIKKAMFILQEATPFKISKIHVVNVVPLADTLFSMVKPFIKNEILGNIIFHTDGLDSLKKFIPEKDLPQNLGGKGPTIQQMQDKMKTMLLNNEEYFQSEILKRVDETKRPGKPKNSSDLFGIEGSFKKLDID